MKKNIFKIYFLLLALDSISFSLIAPILASFLTHPGSFLNNHLSPFAHYSLYGLLITIFPLMFMLSAPWLGILSDKFGRKKILLYCLIIMLLVFCGYSAAFMWENIWIFIMARILAGISASSQGIVQAAIADLSTSQTKPQYMSTMAIGMTLGLILGPLLASCWNESLQWLPFLIIIIFNLFSIVLLAVFIKNSVHQNNAKQNNHLFLKKFLLNKDIISLLSIFLLFELGWSLFYQSIPPILNIHWLMDNHKIGFISAYVGAILAGSLSIAMKIGMRFFSITHLILLGLILGVIGFTGMIFNISLLYFLIGCIPITIAVALIYPCLITRLSDLVGPNYQGFVMGITDALLAFSFAVTSIFSSVLIYFSIALPYMIAAICWVIAAVLCLRFQEVATCDSSMIG